MLVHGSEGTDTTLLLTTLAQLILDPGCRTLSGFLALLEREWVLVSPPDLTYALSGVVCLWAVSFLRLDTLSSSATPIRLTPTLGPGRKPPCSCCSLTACGSFSASSRWPWPSVSHCCFVWPRKSTLPTSAPSSATATLRGEGDGHHAPAQHTGHTAVAWISEITCSKGPLAVSCPTFERITCTPKNILLKWCAAPLF